MLLRRAAFCALVLANAPACAQTPAIDQALGDVTVTADVPKEGAYVGEMILLTLRSSIRAQITLHDIRQPALQNFDWQQFGNDRAIETMVNGFRVAGIERSLAVFPRRAGHLAIEPFVRHVTVMTPDGGRAEGDFSSAPLDILVRAHEGVEPAGSWWLPAKSVAITDIWDRDPEKLGLNDTAQRMLVIEAAGITADRLPPPPQLRAAGLISFAGPAERATLVTPDGPVARAVYRWNIRPVSDAPAMVPAIHIPWFDTMSRQMRDANVAERRVGFVDPLGETRARAAADRQDWRIQAGILALVAGLAWGLAAQALLPGLDLARFAPLPAPLRALRRAARRGDVRAFHAAAADAERCAPERWRGVAAVPAVAAGMAEAEAWLYGTGQRQQPGIMALARLIAREWRARAGGQEMGGLVPMDGGMPKVASGWWPLRLAGRSGD